IPPRSPKMNRFIFGFQRRVWCPKWTPASKSSRMLTTATGRAPFSGCRCSCYRRDWVEPARRRSRHRHPAIPPGRGRKASAWYLTFSNADADIEAVSLGSGVMSEPLEQLAEEIRVDAWELALAVVEEGLRDDQIPPLARLARTGQLGDMPTFIAELAAHIVQPKPERLGRGSALAAIVRDHAREREALGFAPRDIVTEFLVLRRVLWRLVLDRS